MLESILNFLKSGNNSENAPEGVCPNCWGRQEYSGRFFDAMKNEGIDVNRLSEKKGWVQDYAEKHLAGIKLESIGNESVCPKCKVSYRPS